MRPKILLKSSLRPWSEGLLCTHADGQGVDISFTVCLFFCNFVCVSTYTEVSAEDKASDVKFARRFIYVYGTESQILVNFAPPVAQNRTNRRARWPRPPTCKH